jgi:hypothetical protein
MNCQLSIAEMQKNLPHNGDWHTVLRIRDVYPRSRIPDPDFYPSRIPNPKTATKEKGEKKFVVIPFFVA